MRRRLLAALLLASAGALVLGAGTGAAKFPYFSVELDPPSPRAGQPVTVIVRLWDDADHTQPSTWRPSGGPLGDLLEFRGDGGRVPVTLTPFGVGEYRAEVVLREGNWQLIPFPHSGGAPPDAPDGYPEPLTVTVASPVAALVPMGALIVALFGVAALTASRIWRRSRRHVALSPRARPLSPR